MEAAARGVGSAVLSDQSWPVDHFAGDALRQRTLQRQPPPIFTISQNSDSANGITDRRDCRTNAIPFSGGWLLISRSATDRCSGLTGARSTVDHSASLNGASL